VEDAYERPNAIEIFGGDTAAASARQYGTTPYDPAAPPPAGSFVFYACGGPVDGTHRDWGHVGLALGDGRVVHAWDEVRVDDARAVQALRPAAGWTAPRLIGWTPVARILEDHQPRDWADD
jgi:cell wall-associated NlpC family hydrolase